MYVHGVGGWGGERECSFWFGFGNFRQTIRSLLYIYFFFLNQNTNDLISPIRCSHYAVVHSLYYGSYGTIYQSVLFKYFFFRQTAIFCDGWNLICKTRHTLINNLVLGEFDCRKNLSTIYGNHLSLTVFSSQ